jgi:hypothetical protein
MALQDIIVCTKHSPYPSIKAGGYGTAGCAINGDIIVDLGGLIGIDVEPPQPGGSFTSLRDMPFFGAKGKSKAGAPVADTSAQNSGKRKRQEDNPLRSYDRLRKKAVATFLHGPPLPDGPDGPSPMAASSSGSPEIFDAHAFTLS